MYIASELEAALVPHQEPSEVFVTDDSEDDYDYDYEESPALPVAFDISGNRLRTRADFRVPGWLRDADSTEAGSVVALRRFLEGLLENYDLDLYKLELLGQYGQLWLDHRNRDIELGNLVAAAEDVVALLDATRGGELTMTTAAGLVKAGHVHSLIGKSENFWFDAKVSHYALDGLAGKISLAESVARFCNGEGGILVIGLETKSVGGSEVVSRVKPLPFDMSMAQRYRKIIDQHVYPFPSGMRVTAVPMMDGNGMTLLVEVPSQPSYDKPFLVSGAIVGDKSRGEFISVVQRRDDGSEPIRASMIHAWITAGRALIQREPPRERPTGNSLDGGETVQGNDCPS